MFKRTIATGLLIGAAALPSAASATVTINSITGNPGFLTGQIQYSPGGIVGNPSNTAQNLSVGRIRMSGIDNSTMSAVTFDTYCIDIFHWAQNGTFELQAFSLPDATKQAQIAKLLGHTAGFIDAAGSAAAKKDISAAIQIAVWEIVNESGTSGYSIGSGLFQVSNSYGTVTGGARTLAQNYLDSMGGWANPTGFKYTMMAAVNPVGNQRQVFFAAAAVPEPSTWALLIVGFGMIGGAMRRRRTTIAYA